MALELTSVSGVQSYLQDTTADSTLLTTLCNAAETMIARRCSRYDPAGVHWGSAARTERLDGNIAQHVLLTWVPVTAIASVSITTSDSQSYTVTLTNLECDGIALASLAANTAGLVGRLGYRQMLPAPVSAWFDTGLPQPSPWAWPASPNFGGNRSGVVVTYTGGYATVPTDLTLAATMLVAQMYRESTRDPALVSERLGEYARAFREGTTDDLTIGGVLSLLAPYRRYVV